ncbi:MAG: Phycocyanobilin lyase beta subunit [Cyanobacteriota bacterium]
MTTVMASIEQLIAAVDTADSAVALVVAVRQLAASRSPLAVPALTTVLRFNNPGAAVAAVEGLIQIGEPAIPHLLANMDGFNYGARAWATRACAGIGDPRALDLLREAALTDFALSVRRAAAKGLGFLKWQSLPADQQLAVQNTIYEALVQVTHDAEWVVRYAAIAGLENLAKQAPRYREAIIETIVPLGKTDSEAIVRERSRWAIAGLTPGSAVDTIHTNTSSTSG